MAKNKNKQSTNAASNKPKPDTELIGSSNQPAVFKFADGSEIQLADVVRNAFENSELSVEDWNNLPEDQRESLIVHEVITLESEAKESANKKAAFKFTFKFKVTNKEGEKVVTRSANADTEKEAFQDVWSKLVKEFDKHFIEYSQDFKKEKLD